MGSVFHAQRQERCKTATMLHDYNDIVIHAVIF